MQDNPPETRFPRPPFFAASFFAVAALLAVSGACSPYDPEEEPPSFFIPGAHQALTCAECHGPAPFVTFVWDRDCITCHEEDRKANDHFIEYASCSNNGGCHLDTHLTFADVFGGGVVHDFLPLEGVHSQDCVSCHSSASPSSADIVPVGGNPELCWTCHEEDRKVLVATGTATTAPIPQHYVEDPTLFPEGTEVRWDCKACHDAVASGQSTLIPDWDTLAGYHGNSVIRVPHGTVNTDPVTNIAVANPNYVSGCEGCHPVNVNAYTCTTACHSEIFLVSPHTTWAPGERDATCTVAGCHPNADNRLQSVF